MSDKTVRDAMTASPTAIAGDKTVVEAARTMTTENVGSLPVVEEQKLVGMVTDRDLVINVLAKDLDPHKVPVADVATHDPVSASPDESLDTALQRMADEQVRRLPGRRGRSPRRNPGAGRRLPCRPARVDGPDGREDLRELIPQASFGYLESCSSSHSRPSRCTLSNESTSGSRTRARP